MRAVIAPDAFKGSADAERVAAAMMRGVRRVGGWEAVVLPMADGGEGTADALSGGQGERVWVRSVDAFGRAQDAWYARLGTTAIVEAAVGSGYLAPAQRAGTGLDTTSLGTGMLAAAALADRAVERVVIALGGTGAVDGGLGLLTAVGGRAYDARGREVAAYAHELGRVAKVVLPQSGKRLEGWYDVGSPLFGATGSVRMFGPQKGVAADAADGLEAAMEHWAQRVAEAATSHGPAWFSQPGAGAAGGMGFAVLAAGGRLVPGAEAVAEWQGLDGRLTGADLCLTGEGKLDRQTEQGKVVLCVARHAHRAGIPTAILVGSLDLEDEGWLHALDAYPFCIVDRPMDREQSMAKTEALVERAAERLTRVISRVRRAR